MSFRRFLRRPDKPPNRGQFEQRDGLLRRGLKSRKRRPPEAGLPIPAIPPSGPLPKQGGAEAPLDYSA